MIDEKEKYWTLGARGFKPTTTHVISWDQRRVVSITLDEALLEPEPVAIEHYRRLSSQLPPDVCHVYLSDTGEIASTSSDPEHDWTVCPRYPALSEIPALQGIRTVKRDELEELERLGPDVDLVGYPPCAGASATKAVFKYSWCPQYSGKVWKETNLWMRLPRHPNIVPFDKLVIDELEGRVVGFTSSYVPGGNLWKNRPRVFKLKWLKQLMEVVDLLNLRYRIAHQDIAPRNIVVDDATDTVKLIDFNEAARLGLPPMRGEESTLQGEYCDENRNDVKGLIFTAYELITLKDDFRRKPHDEQNLDDLNIEWVKDPKVKLDHPVASYRQALQEWQELRAGKHDDHADDAPEAISWPARPKPPLVTTVAEFYHLGTKTRTLEEITEVAPEERRCKVLERGGKVLTWERPPQRIIDSGIRVLSTGQILECQC